MADAVGNEAMSGSGETPTQLIPKMGEFPVSNSAFYKQLIMTEKAGSSAVEGPLEEQVDPFRSGLASASRPTVGVLLTFEQGWYQEGLALGELRKSLCLAPGEVTKLAVVDWRRDTKSKEASTRTQEEELRAETADASAAVQIQQAIANETRSGSSLSMGSSTHVEGSMSGGGLLFSASGSASSSSHMGYAASSSTGHRDIASAAAKNIERRTEQRAQSTRSTRATQIRELTESENQTTSTRVIANYNHAHALTMQYYEVLQIYSLRTKVVQGDRCVFIPMEPLSFTQDGMEDERFDDTVIELLRRVLQDFGANELDEMVGNWHAKAPDLQTTIGDLAGNREALASDVTERAAALDAARNARDAAIAARNATKSALETGAARDFLKFMIEAPQLAARLAAENAVVAAAEATLKVSTAAHQSVAGALAEVDVALATKRQAFAEFGRMYGLLDQHRVFLNQQMWMRIDDYKWHSLLAGKTYPDGPFAGQEIGGLVDPNPVGYFGNYVAFKWDFPRGASKAKNKAADDFEQLFGRRASTSTRIALPTEGVFAEAVLGQSNSAEKIDITRFWNWQDSPIPILPPEMSPVSSQSRARDVSVPAPLDFGEAIIALRDAGADPTMLSDEAILNALKNSIGNDHAALIAAATTAGINASDNASAGAGRAGQRTIDAMKNVQDFTVGLANSEVGKLAAGAIAAGATGGMSSVGGLLNAANAATKVIDLSEGDDGDKSKANTKTTDNNKPARDR